MVVVITIQPTREDGLLFPPMPASHHTPPTVSRMSKEDTLRMPVLDKL